MAKTKKTQARRPLPNVEEFIRLVQSRLSEGGGNWDGIWFSHRDEGTLFLDPDEATAYARLIAELMRLLAQLITRYTLSLEITR